MRVAVAEMRGYVSPRLAWCTHVRLAVIDAGRIVSDETQDVRGFGPAALIGLLSALELDTIVCGAISPESEQALERQGVGVIWGVIGKTNQVLLALARGQLRNDDVVSQRGECSLDATLPPSRAVCPEEHAIGAPA